MRPRCNLIASEHLNWHVALYVPGSVEFSGFPQGYPYVGYPRSQHPVNAFARFLLAVDLLHLDQDFAKFEGMVRHADMCYANHRWLHSARPPTHPSSALDKIGTEEYDQKISKLVQPPKNRQRHFAKQNGLSAHGFPGHYCRGLRDQGGVRFL